MDNKTLADKVVVLGVGEIVVDPDGIELFLSPDGEYLYFSEVGDSWRVAGALMEESPGDILIPDGENACIINDKLYVAKGSLPRAIIEACVAALASEGNDS